LNNINIAKKNATGFIVINGSVLDYELYCRSMMLLKHYVRLKVGELLEGEGFVEEQGSTLRWYLKEKDLELTLSFSKKHNPLFI